MHKRRIITIILTILIVCCNLFTACDKGYNPLPFTEGSFSVHFLDVGQGDAILVCFSDGKTMLIDTGEASQARTNYVKDCIKGTGKNKIDYLVITHADSDHIGNALTLTDAFGVGVAYLPDVKDDTLFNELTLLKSALAKKNTEIKVSSYIQSIEGDDWFVGFLSPAPAGNPNSSYDDFNASEMPTSSQSNNLSPIIYLECKGKRFLFTGDAGVSQERLVIDNYKSSIYDLLFGKSRVNLDGVDVLKVSHHGASDATSEYFLETVRPKNAIISVGENNYGHPSSATLLRIQTISPDVDFYRTDLNGTISVGFDANFNLKFSCINASKKN